MRKDLIRFFLCFLTINLVWDMSFYSWAILAVSTFVVLGTFISFVIFLVACSCRKKVLVTGMIFLAFLSVPTINNIKVVLTMNKANKIFSALESYKNDNGRYPSNLEKLVPKYMKRVPYTIMSLTDPIKYDYRGPDWGPRAWGEAGGGRDGYTLTFPYLYWAAAYYHSEKGEWVIDGQ